MVETEIKIVDFKDTSAIRTSFTTENHGKMSAFKNEGSTLIADLKANVQKYIVVDVGKNKKDDRTYYNIREFLGLATDKSKEEIADNINKIANSIPKSPRSGPEYEQAMSRKSVKGSAYEKDPVGLAVEVFNAIYQQTDYKGSASQMVLAIDLVKQAQKAFS